MSPPTNNWKCRRTENRFYEEIVTDKKIDFYYDNWSAQIYTQTFNI